METCLTPVQQQGASASTAGACGHRGCPPLLFGAAGWGVVCACHIFISSASWNPLGWGLPVAFGLAGMELVAGCGVVCLSTS